MGVWFKSWGCWALLMADSINFLGYFNSKNIPFKVLHSCKKKSCVDDNRFALSSIVFKICRPRDFESAGEDLCLCFF